MRGNRILSMLAAGTGLALAVGVPALAADIDSPEGPLTKVQISPDLNCRVDYLGDTYSEFFSETACGTFFASGEELFGPDHVPAGSMIGREGWTPVSQETSGSGTAQDPYTIVTVVTGGSVEITQTDRYVVGENAYRTTTSVKNISDAAIDGYVYHGADCYLQDSDYGYGTHDAATGTITCQAPDENGEKAAGTRVEQFIPLTADSTYYYGRYSDVWNMIETRDPLPNMLDDADTHIDNGMALGWAVDLAPGASAEYSV